MGFRYPSLCNEKIISWLPGTEINAAGRCKPLNEQIFSDGITSISIIGGTVRLDFFTFSPVEKEAGGQPKPVLQHRLVVPLPGFLQMAGKIQEAVQAIGKLNSGSLPVNQMQDVATPRQDTGTHKGGAADQPEEAGDMARAKKPSKPPFP